MKVYPDSLPDPKIPGSAQGHRVLLSGPATIFPGSWGQERGRVQARAQEIGRTLGSGHHRQHKNPKQCLGINYGRPRVPIGQPVSRYVSEKNMTKIRDGTMTGNMKRLLKRITTLCDQESDQEYDKVNEKDEGKEKDYESVKACGQGKWLGKWQGLWKRKWQDRWQEIWSWDWPKICSLPKTPAHFW